MRSKQVWVSLTDLEKKWLGAVVRRSDGLVGQVWAIPHPCLAAAQGCGWWPMATMSVPMCAR